MKEIKIAVNGKEITLTPEQIKSLGIEVDDGCVCDRARYNEYYFYIKNSCGVRSQQERGDCTDMELFSAGNYFRDEDYAKQVALHQKLNNLLRRYSEQHGGDVPWDGKNQHFNILFDCIEQKYCINYDYGIKVVNMVYFSSRRIAEQALEEVVKPFIAANLDFVW